MKKKRRLLAFLTSFVMLCASSMTVYAAPELGSPDIPVITEPNLYASSVTNKLSISNKTATCESKVKGLAGVTTKIEITQSLEKQVVGWWVEVDKWSKTYYTVNATYTTTKSSLESNTYQLRTIAKVYSSTKSETIARYSDPVTI